MRLLLLFFFTILAGQPLSCSARPDLRETGLPLHNDDLRIQWLVPSNQLPKEITVFKVRPAEFDEALLKKIVSFGGFSNQSAVVAKLKPCLQGGDAWIQTQDKRYLTISPAKGRIYFQNFQVISGPGDSIEGVPSDEEVLEQALAILEQLGVKESELRRKPNTNELFLFHDVRHQGQRNKDTGLLERTVIARGVWLFRAADRIGLAGRGMCGGLLINFGNRSQIAELEFVWRRLEPGRVVRTLEPEAIVGAIKQGKAFVQKVENPATIKSLRIVEATVYYFGEHSSRVQREMYPFVSLKAEADVGGKTADVFLNCPLVLN